MSKNFLDQDAIQSCEKSETKKFQNSEIKNVPVKPAVLLSYRHFLS